MFQLLKITAWEGFSKASIEESFKGFRSILVFIDFKAFNYLFVSESLSLLLP